MKLEQKEFLLLYEMPVWFEFIGIKWLQNILAKYLAYTVTRKLNRYQDRIKRKEWLIKHNLI